MMNMPSSYDKYKQTKFNTADQGTLILMLYDGAISSLNQAKELLNVEKMNREKFSTCIVKATNIVYELMASLNMEPDNPVRYEIAKNLWRLYEYITWRLGQADVKKDVAMIDDALYHLNNLREAWEIVFKKGEAKNASSFSEQPMVQKRSSLVA